MGKVASKSAAPLPRFMAVIGANGAGKSTLLDALGFIGDSLENGVEAACDAPHRGGFDRLRTRGVEAPIKFEVRYRQSATSRPISYSLHVNVDRHGRPQVVYERLRQGRAGAESRGRLFNFLELKSGRGVVWAGEGSEEKDSESNRRDDIRMSDRQVLGIATLGTLADHPRIAQFRDFLSGWYLSYFNPQLAKRQPISGSEPHLNRSGDNLANYLRFIQRERPLAFQAMLDRIAKKIPGVQSIHHEETVDKRLLLAFHAEGFDQPFFQQDMSDGTLKLLAYMLLMEDPRPAPLVGIEEPENGLYQELLAPLAQEFKRFASRAAGPQVLVTTHSPNFIDALGPDEVWLLEKGSDGCSELRLASGVPEVAQLYGEGLPMGSLWYSRYLGSTSPA